MELDFNCITCNINQVIKVMDLIDIKRDLKENVLREVLEYLSKADYKKCNPEVIGGTWKIIMKYVDNKNPYKEIKDYYNLETLKILEDVESLIERSQDRFNTALKIAISGNLIDFAAKHKFDFEMLKEKIMNIDNLKLAVNHGVILQKKLNSAKSLLYLGDNCGEICLDKVFITYIKNEFPHIKIFYGVRGQEIINDITYEDAIMVGMDNVADIIENGDDSLGTVMTRVSDEFRNRFYEADVIIAKGQGNYESLSEIDRPDIFHLFMAKCKPVASLIGVEPMSIVCVENKPSK